ncbi:MAG: peptidase [Cycloclasticus sp. symbiont of Poecilosclerida sp. M]|nr:MAG: peptidase [Cycloclasticus sp. symbiont of Poecilosclerida sp. M]
MRYINFINPNRIQWCCADAGISIDELAIETGISSKNISSDKPLLTYNQLNKVALYFGRGVLFFLSKNEVKEEKVHTVNFRTLANKKPSMSLKLRKLIERTESQRDRYVGLLEELEVETETLFEPLKYNKNILLSAENTRKWLNVGAHNTFESYRAAIERRGILVFQSNGYNGKWKIPKESTILGFSLYDPVCPLIVVRKQLWPSQQAFTLMHELGHILLHKMSSIDDAEDYDAHRGKEYEANQFAGLLLVPKEYLATVNLDAKPNEYGEYIEWLRPYCKAWGVSSEVILRRLSDTQLIAREDYEGFRRWSKNHELPSMDGGNRAYRHREPQHIFGNKFVRSVFDAKNSKKLTLAKASSYLDGLKIQDVHLLEKHLANN